MELKLKNNKGLVDYCITQLGRPYWYGTFGQIATKSLLQNRRKAYPRYYTANDFEQQFNQRVHDCVGLIKGYMWSSGPNEKPVYLANGFRDVSADMLYNLCKRKGTSMSTMPDVPGVCVFMKGHVGVYIGDGWVVEARGHAYGVVKTRLKERPWNKWGFVNEIQYLI